MVGYYFPGRCAPFMIAAPPLDQIRRGKMNFEDKSSGVTNKRKPNMKTCCCCCCCCCCCRCRRCCCTAAAAAAAAADFGCCCCLRRLAAAVWRIQGTDAGHVALQHLATVQQRRLHDRLCAGETEARSRQSQRHSWQSVRRVAA